jgi:hypothetical protein
VAGEELTAQYSDPPPPPLEAEREEPEPQPEPESEPEPEPAALASYPESLDELEEETIRTRSPYPD